MKIQRFLKKILSSVLVTTTVLGVNAGITLPVQASTALYPNQTITSGYPKELQLISYLGASNGFSVDMETWIDPQGATQYAYCVNPTLGGQNASGGYAMDIHGLLDGRNPVDFTKSTIYSARIWGAIQAGFPSKTPAQIGLTDTTGLSQADINYEAYTATKMAIWALIHDAYYDATSWMSVVKPPTPFTGNQAGQVLSAFNQIYSAGVATTTIPSVGKGNININTSATATKDTVDSTKYSQTYSVTGISTGTFTVSFDTTPTDGSQRY